MARFLLHINGMKERRIFYDNGYKGSLDSWWRYSKMPEGALQIVTGSGSNSALIVEPDAPLEQIVQNLASALSR
jgi:hypothetical protein